MPIEDVQHLLQNSVTDCAAIFVDSSKRDYLHYPTPSEYVVDLVEPVKNVFGIDVLDAAIANCMYNVDYNNCHTRVIGIDTSLSTSLQSARSAFAPASNAASRTSDQTDELWDQADLSVLNAEFFALGFATPLRAWLADVTMGSYQVCVLDLATAAANASALSPTPANTAASLLADVAANGNTYAFALVETRVSSVSMLCTTSMAAASSPSWVAFNGAFYLPGDPAAVASAFANPGGFAIVPVSSSSGSSNGSSGSSSNGNGNGNGGSTGSSSLYDVVTYAVTQLTVSQWATLASVAPTMLQFSFGTATIEVGNYTGYGMLQSSVQDAFTACVAASSITIGSTTLSGITKQGIMRFDSVRNYRFMISTVNSSAANVIGFDLETSGAVNQTPRSMRTFGAVQLGGQAVPLYCSVLRSQGQQMDAPGLANLLGVRYIALRCPEIEQYICTTGKYGPFSVGIGVFKLASTNEVGQVRFDYVSLVHKPFHPIGKLLRFTLRFELPDGSLYDFKGINNQLLLSLKYYTPTPASARPDVPQKRVVSQLNPDYDPDFMAFMARQTAYAPRMQDPGYDPFDEDDESEDDDEGDGDGDGDGRADGDGDEEDDSGDAPYEQASHAVALRRFGDGVQRRVLSRERDAFIREY